MPTPAHIRSVETLESFRTALILYISKARPALEGVSTEALQTRLWLQNDRRMYWQNQLRRRALALESAQQALFRARLSELPDAILIEQMAVQKTKRAVAESEEKLKIVRRWDREFDGLVSPLVKQLDKLHTLLSNDLPQAIAFLAQAIKTLEDYADIAPTAPLETTAVTQASPPANEGGAPAGGPTP